MTVNLRPRISKYTAFADVEDEEPILSIIEHKRVYAVSVEAVYQRTDGEWNCWGVWVKYHPINRDGSVNRNYTGGESIYLTSQPQWLMDFMNDNVPTGESYPLDVWCSDDTSD
jgi:hypothetical protein